MDYKKTNARSTKGDILEGYQYEDTCFHGSESMSQLNIKTMTKWELKNTCSGCGHSLDRNLGCDLSCNCACDTRAGSQQKEIKRRFKRP